MCAVRCVEEACPGMPRHVAVVMDGNGRWARRRGLPRSAGHEAGVDAAKKLVEHCRRLGIRHLTIFAFSSENMGRPSGEVAFLLDLIPKTLHQYCDELLRHDIRVHCVGDRSILPLTTQKLVDDVLEETRSGQAMDLVVAFGYGGRWDIVAAARRLMIEAKAGLLEPEALDESLFTAHLQLAGLPDPDLLVRTGGEHRISNFLLWHIAYAELYFSDVLWPDFDETRLDEALQWYRRRIRRFGLLPDGDHA
jgi:undecaprenyl diphosphate synthase